MPGCKFTPVYSFCQNISSVIISLMKSSWNLHVVTCSLPSPFASLSFCPLLSAMKAAVLYRDHNPGWFSQLPPALLYSDPPELSSQVSMGTSIYIPSLPQHLLTAIEHIFMYDCVCYMYTVVFLKGTFKSIKPAISSLLSHLVMSHLNSVFQWILFTDQNKTE